MAHTQKPDPARPDYQHQVAASIQDLVSGRRGRDPAMSGASTGRLILEGVLENVRIYRLHKQEAAREAERKDGEARRKGGKKKGSSRQHKGGRDGEQRRGSHGRERGGETRQHRHAQDQSHDAAAHEQRHRHGHTHRRPHAEKADPTPPEGPEHTHPHSTAAEPPPLRANHLMSGALHTADLLRGPDGTPSGSLPAKSKGVGFVAHARSVYRHVKAEQDAGLRSKGVLEKRVDAFLQKKRATREREEEPLLGCSGEYGGKGGYGPRSARGEHGGRRHRDRRGGKAEREEGGHVDGPERDAGQENGMRVGTPAPGQESGIGWQSAPFARVSPPVLGPSRPSAPHERQSDAEAGGSRDGVHFGESSRSAGQPPSMRVQSPAPSAYSPSVRTAPSVRDGYIGGGESDRGVSRAPTILVQSPTPPDLARSVRPPTPYARGPPSRVHSSESEGGGPTTSPKSPSPTPMPTPPPVIVVPYPATPSVVDVPVLETPAACSTARPPPPPASAPVPRPSAIANSAHGALMTGIMGGAKLCRVGGENKNDKSAGSKGKVIAGFSSDGKPVYEGTWHSDDVEAREHAQAVEQRERKQAEELSVMEGARTATPFIAPQPRAKLPNNFQTELAAKLGRMNLSRGNDSEVVPSNAPSVLKRVASHESWRTVLSGHDEGHNEPNQAFRERLGSQLSAGTCTPSRVDSPAAIEFHASMAAHVASGPGWGWPDDLPRSGDDAGRSQE